jgi:hypothetical protein
MALFVWRALAMHDGALYYVAAFFALAAQAVWSVTYLTVERLPESLILYGVFGAIYLGVPILARRLHRPLLPAHLAGVVLLASLALLLFLTTGPVAAPAIWGLALLLAILNAALKADAALPPSVPDAPLTLTTRAPRLHVRPRPRPRALAHRRPRLVHLVVNRPAG